MATLVVTPTALADLDSLIRTLSLPPDTSERVKASLRPLTRFPLLGARLEGRWAEFRFLLGPWRWMLILCLFDAAADRVSVVTIQDARSAVSVTTPKQAGMAHHGGA